jgi:hypothetical protein
MTLRNFSLAAVFLIAATVVPGLAQGPLHKRVNFTVDVPFELKEANTLLPAGSYVLFQLNTSDPHLFALYRDDMTHPPIAMIRTMRINNSTRWPSKAKVLLDIDESSAQNHLMLEGWNIPGDDGWEVISVVTSHGTLTRSR